MSDIQSAKSLIRAFVGGLDAAAPGEEARAVFREFSGDGLAYRGVHPFNFLTGPD
ncbi:MAG: nuclear transport factor 2 family protein, partial [Boseongicola sp. SB0670_bin_30]|nr:nuclear transport factor 2 family protein [Boseongicola sp. SB0670_bin_30]